MDCVFNKFKEEGLESLNDLTLELEVTRIRTRFNLLKKLRKTLIEEAKVFNDDFNTELAIF